MDNIKIDNPFNVAFILQKDWIVININPFENINEQIASGIYNNKKFKHLFIEKEFVKRFNDFYS